MHGVSSLIFYNSSVVMQDAAAVGAPEVSKPTPIPESLGTLSSTPEAVVFPPAQAPGRLRPSPKKVEVHLLLRPKDKLPTHHSTATVRIGRSKLSKSKWHVSPADHSGFLNAGLPHILATAGGQKWMLFRPQRPCQGSSSSSSSTFFFSSCSRGGFARRIGVVTAWRMG